VSSARGGCQDDQGWISRQGRRAAIVGIALLSAFGTAAWSTSASATSTIAPIPLAASLGSSGGTWAAIAMGHLNDPLNTFWQLFFASGPSSHWALATPPGVASNGGLVASLSPSGSLLAGFEPSAALRFSPLAQTPDAGATWTAGVLPTGLAVSPDALATSVGHGNVALLRGNGGKVVVNSGDLSTWTSIGQAHTVAAGASPSSCGIESLTAVAMQADGAVLVGAACAHGDRPGIFMRQIGGWASVGPTLPGSTAGPTRVLRLIGTATGATALISKGIGHSEELFATSSTDGSVTWAVSSALPLSGNTLLSTGFTASGQLIAESERANGTRWAAVADGTTSAWQELAPLPAGTDVVGTTADGQFDALIADQSTLRVDTLGAGGWSRTQTIDVPIQYGSSG
jgi:hypothetical protein